VGRRRRAIMDISGSFGISWIPRRYSDESSAPPVSPPSRLYHVHGPAPCRSSPWIARHWRRTEMAETGWPWPPRRLERARRKIESQWVHRQRYRCDAAISAVPTHATMPHALHRLCRLDRARGRDDARTYPNEGLTVLSTIWPRGHGLIACAPALPRSAAAWSPRGARGYAGRPLCRGPGPADVVRRAGAPLSQAIRGYRNETELQPARRAGVSAAAIHPCARAEQGRLFPR